MPDPIQGLRPTGPIDVAQSRQTGAPAGAPPSGASTGAASVNSADIVRAEALLSMIAATSGSVPSVDAEKVAELRQALQSGTYQVNPQQIAQKIVELESLLAAQGGGR